DSFFVIPNKDTKNQLFDEEIKRKIENHLINSGYLIKNFSEAQYTLTYRYEIDSGQYVPGSEKVFSPGQKIQVYSSDGTYTGAIQTSTNLNYKTISYKEYTSHLQINVFKKDNEKPVWVGESFSSGRNDDLRVLIEYLLYANLKYFGKDTQKNIKDSIKFEKNNLKIFNKKT
ncbi:MAG: DUF4136 domain-containing protein, partial [Candidatus Omnitrophica bacterium]|nr:DUF4136 domain-containing protein [Candidatus Omnitrophota bacterium]